jgi:hypothetical protein
MSFDIVMTGSVHSTNDPSKFAIRLPQAIDFSRYKVGLASLTTNVSWPNINVVNGSPLAVRTNGNFQIIWPNGSGFTTYNVIAPNNSFFAISDLNAFLQFFQVSNGLYLIQNNVNVYFCSFTPNTGRNAVAFSSNPIPTSLGTGASAYSFPPGAPTWSLPTTSAGPQLIVPSPSGYNTGTFGSFIGFNPGTYPPAPQTTNYNVFSSFVPTVSNVTTIFIISNISQNKITLPQGMLFSFTPIGAFGTTISEQPLTQTTYKKGMGTTDTVTIQLLDQSYYPVQLQDPCGFSVTINLISLDEKE